MNSCFRQRGHISGQKALQWSLKALRSNEWPFYVKRSHKWSFLDCQFYLIVYGDQGLVGLGVHNLEIHLSFGV